ncbi:MAG: S8 family serine peptidase [Acidobacteriota bacterium]|nr:S8 family serine peptidase [Acidobacteriota bacterium]
MYASSRATAQSHFISLLLVYALIISLLAPLAIKRAQASAETDRGGKEKPPAVGNANRELSLNSATQASGQRSGELLVRFRGGVSEQEKATLAAAHGGRRKGQLRGESGIEKLEVAPGQEVETLVLQLRLNPAVEFAEPNFLIQRNDLSVDAGARNIARPFTAPNHSPNQGGALDSLDPIWPGPVGELNSKPQSPYSNSLAFNSPLQSQRSQPDDPRFNEQWALSNSGQNGGQFGSDIGVTAAWQTTTGSQSTVIAVIDSGIDFAHPELTNNRWTNPAPSPNGDIHGWDYITDTGVVIDEQGHGTAIAGIIAAQGNNASGISGVMWRASLMSLRVLDNTGTGDVANAVEAIDYAVAHGAHVINISWGTSGESVALKEAIERALRRGVVVVCSAGNNRQDLEQTPYYPASFNIRDLIAVASSDNVDQLASWSNWSRRRVSVAAPGTSILTTHLGGGYWLATGSSASAPLVSGVAGLIKLTRPWVSAREVAKAISDGARQVASLSGKVSSGGVVSASGALENLRGSPNPYPSPRPRYGSGGRGPGGSFNTTPPPQTTGAPGANLPNLDQLRNAEPVAPRAREPIQSNLLCADCDPQNGGGGGSYYPPNDPNFSTSRERPPNETGQPGVDLGSRNFNWSLPLVSLPAGQVSI